jgi:hypothetical protein
MRFFDLNGSQPLPAPSKHQSHVRGEGRGIFFNLRQFTLASGCAASYELSRQRKFLIRRLFYGVQVHATILYPFTLDELRSLRVRRRRDITRDSARLCCNERTVPI